MLETRDQMVILVFCAEKMRDIICVRDSAHCCKLPITFISENNYEDRREALRSGNT